MKTSTHDEHTPIGWVRILQQHTAHVTYHQHAKYETNKRSEIFGFEDSRKKSFGNATTTTDDNDDTANNNSNNNGKQQPVSVQNIY